MDRLRMFNAVTSKLQNRKSYGLLLISIIAIGILLSPPIFSSLTNSLTIPSSGTITPIASISGPQYLSQYREMFFQASSDGSVTNWTLVAQTCAEYGINYVNLEIGDPSTIVVPLPSSPDSALTFNATTAIAAFHAVGIKVWADFDFMLDPTNSSTECGVDSTTPNTDWFEIADPASMSYLQEAVTEICRAWNFDGFFCDYTYWNFGPGDGPFDPSAQASFTSWMLANYNITVTNFPNCVTGGTYGSSPPPTGEYASQFTAWRVYTINTLYSDVAQWVHAVKPNMIVIGSEFDFAYINGPNTTDPSYWWYWIGQDAGAYVADGFVQVLSPMDYAYPYQTWGDTAIGWNQYVTGGPHGTVALMISLTDMEDIGASNYNPMPTADWVAQVDSIMDNGSDGWQLWSYGGPGEGSGCPYPSVVPYLQALGLPNPPTFTMGNITTTSVTNTSEQVSWQTSSVANSTVEYSTSPLFTFALESIQSSYATITTHNTGTIVSSGTNVTSHSFTLTGLTTGTTYYFRVQSQDPSGTATSEVSTFTAGSG